MVSVLSAAHAFVAIESFVFNTNLTFLYNINTEGFKKNKEIILLPLGFELTSLLD